MDHPFIQQSVLHLKRNMQTKLISSLLLAALADTSDAAVPASRAFVPKTAAVNKALLVRGGAGPLPIDATAKTAAAIMALNGAYEVLASEKNLEAYGVPNVDKFSTYMDEANGANILGFGIAALAILFFDVPAMKAVGVGLVANVIQSLKILLNGTPEELGIAPAGQWLGFGMVSFLSHALLTGADYGNTVAKVFAAFWGLCAIQGKFAPESSLKSWGFPEQSATNNTPSS